MHTNADAILEKADIKEVSYQQLLLSILESELELKEIKAQEKKLKNAGFPVLKTIDEFDLKFQKSITQRQVNRLLEMDR